MCIFFYEKLLWEFLENFEISIIFFLGYYYLFKLLFIYLIIYDRNVISTVPKRFGVNKLYIMLILYSFLYSGPT
jgi:hypothetical protein